MSDTTDTTERNVNQEGGSETDEAKPDRFGLWIGKPNSERRDALFDEEEGEPHSYKPSDGVISARTHEGALALMQLHSYQGRVFLSYDAAGLLSAALLGLAHSLDAIAIYDGVREGRLTVSDVQKLLKKELDEAARQQREARKAEAEAQASANAAVFHRSRSARSDS